MCDDAEHAAWRALARVSVPVIAAIHGPCMGGGIAMALHADIRVAADDASFSVPPARLGIAYPREATARLTELVGPAYAKLLLFSAALVDAENAHAMGLIQTVVPKADLDGYVTNLAAQMATLAPLTQRAAKLSVESLADDTLVADAVAAARCCYDSDDFREGVDAFLEKRRPTFKGI